MCVRACVLHRKTNVCHARAGAWHAVRMQSISSSSANSNFAYIYVPGGKFDEIMTQCCTAGEDHASEEENCRNFKPPAVKPEMISACLYSSEICCATRLRINRCKAGVLSAKDGLDCHSPTNETGSEFYKNCCEACKVGLILGAMQESCTMELQYGSPFDDSFNFCCNEMKATDDTIVLSEDSEFGMIFSQQSVWLMFCPFQWICAANRLDYVNKFVSIPANRRCCANVSRATVWRMTSDRAKKYQMIATKVTSTQRRQTPASKFR